MINRSYHENCRLNLSDSINYFSTESYQGKALFFPPIFFIHFVWLLDSKEQVLFFIVLISPLCCRVFQDQEYV